MEMFNVGDKVRRIEYDYSSMKIGDERTILKISESHLYFVGDDEGYAIKYFELVLRTDNPKALERFMVYGTGCDNKSELYTSEKDMSIKARKLAIDESWTGEIIGYKLTPIFKVEKKTVLSKFTSAKKKAKK